ncbi:hypothetical protein C4K03_4704 [Pseudomonas synxantha]|uniref:Uncharacterized protein n=2 Tax=Pseudomonas synxantha TaxID=47883 RepID=A0A3G7UE82_9PSED|nr:hypothetical protein C4K03_4704 [Pseudomonas synxantha]
MSAAFQFSEVGIDPNAPINSVLATNTIVLRDQNQFDCTSSFYPNYEILLPSVGASLYSSGIPGVALRFIKTSREDSPNTFPFTGGLVSTPNQSVNSWGGIEVQLVKVGTISGGGTVNIGKFARKIAPAHGNVELLTATAWSSFTVSVAAKPTCSVLTPNVSVPLGQVSMGDFDSGGRSNAEHFSIDLTCSGSTGGGTTAVHVTLTDQNQPGNRGTALSLSPSSTATGVVLEINNKLGLINYGADSDTPGNPGQWFEGAAGNGNFSIPLTVNYLRTSPTPMAGSANAVATYTLSYQ